jgi:hypothetical protein
MSPILIYLLACLLFHLTNLGECGLRDSVYETLDHFPGEELLGSGFGAGKQFHNTCRTNAKLYYELKKQAKYS